MATHSSILAWKIAWTEEPGGLQSMGSQRVKHVGVTEHTHIHVHTYVNATNTEECSDLALSAFYSVFWLFSSMYTEMQH